MDPTRLSGRTSGQVHEGVTVRSLILGLILAACAGALGPYLELYVQGSNASAYFTSLLAHILIFLLITVVNVGFGTANRDWMFSRGELIVVFILMSLGNASPVILAYWVPVVSGTIYHASAENGWFLHLVPHLPSWLVSPRSGGGGRILRRYPGRLRADPMGGLGGAGAGMGTSPARTLRRHHKHDGDVAASVGGRRAVDLPGDAAEPRHVAAGREGPVAGPLLSQCGNVDRFCGSGRSRRRHRFARLFPVHPYHQHVHTLPAIEGESELCHDRLLFPHQAGGGLRALGLHPAEYLPVQSLQFHRLGHRTGPGDHGVELLQPQPRAPGNGGAGGCSCSGFCG